MTRNERFHSILGGFPRVAVTGWPKTGKTTLTESIVSRDVIHTDDFMNLHWDDVPDAVIDACYEEMFVVEGVQVARALRKGLEVDCVVFLTNPVQHLTPGQDSMGRGVRTIFDQWAATSDTPIFYL